MVYYSFNDIIRAYKISKQALKVKCMRGELEFLKISTCRNNSHMFKIVIPETEIPKIQAEKIAELIFNPMSQPDYYPSLWAEQDKEIEATRAKREAHKAQQKEHEEYLHQLVEEIRNAEAQKKAEEDERNSRFAVLENGYSYIYSDYIKYSPEWQEKRQQRLQIDKFQCQLCGSAKNLQVHHITYEHLGHEPMEDLITLCDNCHRKTHEHDLP